MLHNNRSIQCWRVARPREMARTSSNSNSHQLSRARYTASCWPSHSLLLFIVCIADIPVRATVRRWLITSPDNDLWNGTHKYTRERFLFSFLATIFTNQAILKCVRLVGTKILNTSSFHSAWPTDLHSSPTYHITAFTCDHWWGSVLSHTTLRSPLWVSDWIQYYSNHTLPRDTLYVFCHHQPASKGDRFVWGDVDGETRRRRKNANELFSLSRHTTTHKIQK